jgi:hypothetical protein
MDKTGTDDGLKYIGDGTAIVGVPARDLTAEEVAAAPMSRAALLMSGLYVLAGHNIKKAYAPKPRIAALKGDSAEKEE